MQQNGNDERARRFFAPDGLFAERCNRSENSCSTGGKIPTTWGQKKMKRPIDRENLASEAPPRMVYANSNFAPAWGVLGATRGNFSTPPVSRFEPEASSMQPWDPARASQPVGRTGRYVGWLGKGCSRWEYKMLTRDTPTCFSPVRPTG